MFSCGINFATSTTSSVNFLFVINNKIKNQYRQLPNFSLGLYAPTNSLLHVAHKFNLLTYPRLAAAVASFLKLISILFELYFKLFLNKSVM